MARQADRSLSIVEDVNLLLFTAWEHGARHVSLQPHDTGTVMSYLGPDGGEHTERLSLRYDHIVKRLREMSARLGRVRIDMGGHHWHLEAVRPASARADQVFIHMRPE
jgi:hypothetical protein